MTLPLANVIMMTEKCPDAFPKTSGHFFYFLYKKSENLYKFSSTCQQGFSHIFR